MTLRRDAARVPLAASSARPSHPADDELPTEPAPPLAPTVERLRVQFVTADERLVSNLALALSPGEAFVVRVSLREATAPAASAAPYAVVADLRGTAAGPGHIAMVRMRRPQTPVLALVDDQLSYGDAYAAGATAVVDAGVDSIVACLRSIRQQQRAADTGPLVEGLEESFARVRRLAESTRASVKAPDGAARLLELICDTVERAVLMLVRDGRLRVIASLGSHENGQALASRLGSLVLEVDGAGVLGACCRDGQARAVDWTGAALPSRFVAAVGPPRAHRCAVVPVLGKDRALGVVYADYGAGDWRDDEIEFVELALGQMGVALESRRLRREAATGAMGRSSTC